AFARFRGDPDAPAVALYNLFADRQPNAATGILALGVQALKHLKDALEILWVDADTVVAYRQHPLPALALHPDVNVGRLLAAELQGIADKVLEHLPQLGGIGHYGGKRRRRDHGPTVPDADLKISERVLQDRRTSGRLQGLTASADLRIRQQGLNECMHTGGAQDSVDDEFMSVG